MPFQYDHSSVTDQCSQPVPTMITISISEDKESAPQAATAVAGLDSEEDSNHAKAHRKRHEETHPQIGLFKRRKRWKKPAIKKKRRFGVNIPINTIGYLLESGSDTDDSSTNSAAGNRNDFIIERRVRKKVTHFDPATGGNVIKKVPTRSHGSAPRELFSDAKARESKIQTRGVASSASSSTKKTAVANHPKSKSKSKAKAKKKKCGASIKVQTFDQRLEDLLAFKNEYGHCDVPYTYKANQSLSNWCSNVRYSYGVHMKGRSPTIKMTKERIQSLKALGFEFKAPDSRKKKTV
jgi:hypothetical protein